MIPTWVCLKRGCRGRGMFLAGFQPHLLPLLVSPLGRSGQQLAWARPRAGETKCEAGTWPSGGTGASARQIPHQFFSFTSFSLT